MTSAKKPAAHPAKPAAKAAKAHPAKAPHEET